MRGLSQEKLAELVGCSTPTIGRLESRKRFASDEQLDKIAKALRVPLSELFAEDSQVIKALETRFEVRDRLQDGVSKAIDEALDVKE
jgi:transcriptional regulator with XRE-family HTH domain